MSKKHKHKNTKHDLKIIPARHKNEVLDQLRYYFDLWAGDKTFCLLPEEEIEWLYCARFTPIRIEPAPGTTIGKKIILEFKALMDYLMKMYKVEIAPGLPVIPMHHFVTYYLTIGLYVGAIKPETFSNSNIIKEKFRSLLERIEAVVNQAMRDIARLIDFLAAAFSDPSILYYTVKMEAIPGSNDGKANYILLRISKVQPVACEFNLPEGRRSAFRLGRPFPDNQVHWIKVRPPDTGVLKWQSELDVYIQPHALRRLYERLELVEIRSLRLDLFYSFIFDQELIYENNYLLFPYKAGSSTIGYFKADIVENKILLRTFLFLTNEGTPESRRLKEIAGLGKVDMSYWKIDTLRNFVESDIGKSPVLKKLFTDAGCGELFGLKWDEPEAYTGKIQLAESIQKYLGLDEKATVNNE